MSDDTNQTSYPEENKLGITDKRFINEIESKGVATAEYFIFELDTDIIISSQLICEIHRIAFSELYEWAGKWRTVSVYVGNLIPPEPGQVVQLMYQYIDNLNFKLINSKHTLDHLDCLIFAHYEFVRIHPFNNGNGRTARILMNLVALKLGYKPLELYHRQGDNRNIYINALRLADKGNFELLLNLIRKELTPF